MVESKNGCKKLTFWGSSSFFSHNMYSLSNSNVLYQADFLHSFLSLSFLILSFRTVEIAYIMYSKTSNYWIAI